MRLVAFLECLAIVLLFPHLSLFAEETTISLSDAILKTLESSPGIRIEEEKVQQSEGDLQKASGQFDWIGLGTMAKEQKREHFTDEQEKLTQLSTLLGQRSFSDTRRLQTNTYSLGLRKQTRSGIIVSPNLSTLDLEDLSNNLESENRSDMGVEFTFPLMRGLGEENTGALEMAARSSLSVTELLSKHNISARILQTATAYWASLASLRSLLIMGDTGKRADELFQLVERLVKGGELEPAMMHQAQAKLFQRKADIKQSELSYYESRQRLAVAMGYTPKQIANAPQPEGPFPPVVNIEILGKEIEGRYVDEAFSRRGDYLAAQASIGTHEILLQKAKDDKRPRVDFDFRVGMAGLSEKDNTSRYVRSFYHDKAGPNMFAGLTLEWPFVNNTAIGEFIRRRSLVKEAELNAAELSNIIASDVLVAVERMRSSVQEYKLAKESAESYREAVKHENHKVRMGESSLNSLIDLEDRHVEARLGEISAVRRYASALAELRFITGTLLTEEARNFKFRTHSLMTLPLIQEPKPVEVQ